VSNCVKDLAAILQLPDKGRKEEVYHVEDFKNAEKCHDDEELGEGVGRGWEEN